MRPQKRRTQPGKGSGGRVSSWLAAIPITASAPQQHPGDCAVGVAGG